MDMRPHDRKTRTAAFASLPYLTPELPGVGGTLKREPDDFVVEEIAAYEPSGAGEHLFLWLEKRDLSADELLRHLARRLDVRSADIGMAGVKDRRAVTRQWISVPARCEANVAQIASDRVSVLKSARHGNKLRTGHLRGNRFSLLLRDVVDGAAEREIHRRGRWPFRISELLRGAAVRPRGANAATGPRSDQWTCVAPFDSACQTAILAADGAVFRAVGPVQRGARRTAHQRPLAHGAGRRCDASGSERRAVCGGRSGRRTAPLRRSRNGDHGTDLRAQDAHPQGDAAELEQGVLDDWGLTAADFTRYSQLTSGTRRPLLVWPTNLVVQASERDLRLDFELPCGSYATCLLREYMKSAAADGE